MESLKAGSVLQRWPVALLIATDKHQKSSWKKAIGIQTIHWLQEDKYILSLTARRQEIRCSMQLES